MCTSVWSSSEICHIVWFDALEDTSSLVLVGIHVVCRNISMVHICLGLVHPYIFDVFYFGLMNGSLGAR